MTLKDIIETCEYKKDNTGMIYPYQMYICKKKGIFGCDYQFEEHDKNGEFTGKNYCIARYFKIGDDEK